MNAREIEWRPVGEDEPGERSRPEGLTVVGAPRVLDWSRAEEEEFQRRLSKVRGLSGARRAEVETLGEKLGRLQREKRELLQKVQQLEWRLKAATAGKKKLVFTEVNEGKRR
jgi:uncharacterized sporulation protein YeaH/YhbH (DUF444 family)